MSSEQADLEVGMTYVEKLDFRDQAHKHEMERVAKQEAEQTKRAKLKLREARQETWQIIGVAFFVACVILGIVAAIYLGTRGDDGPDGIGGEERREIACVENGGGFVPQDLLNDAADHGLCVFPGRVDDAPKPVE